MASVVEPDTLVALRDPAVESDELMADLKAVWQEQLADPQIASEIAAILHVDRPEALKSLSGPPVVVEQEVAGLNANDLLVVVATWVATDVLLKALAELGKEAVKDALRQLWKRYLAPRVEGRQSKPNALGVEEEPPPEQHKP